MPEYTATRADFAPVLDQDETILWLGTPRFSAYLIQALPLLLIGLIWGAVDYFGFIRHMKAPDWPAGGFFFLLHLFPLWLGLGNLAITLTAKKSRAADSPPLRKKANPPHD